MRWHHMCYEMPVLGLSFTRELSYLLYEIHSNGPLSMIMACIYFVSLSDWFRATQVLVIMGLVGIAISLFIAMAYIWVPRFNKTLTLYLLTAVCFLSGELRIMAQVDITDTTLLVPCLYVKYLQLIWRSGTRRFHLRAPDLQMNCRDLTLRQGYQDGCRAALVCDIRHRDVIVCCWNRFRILSRQLDNKFTFSLLVSLRNELSAFYICNYVDI